MRQKFLSLILLVTGFIAFSNPGLAHAADTSSNWAGYTATSGVYTGVGGSWIVPTAQSAGERVSANAEWIGIGGVRSRDLIQTGTMAIAEGNGGMTYQAWYEILPDAPVVVPLLVAPGDSITASIVETKPSVWNITLINNTKKQHYTTQVHYDSSLSSAEWIEEMPLGENGFIPLTNFTPVTFTNAWVIKDNKNLVLGAVGAEPINMITRHNTALAVPSPITLATSSFNVTRTQVSYNQPQPSFASSDNNRIIIRIIFQ